MNPVEKNSGAFRVKMNIFWYENLFAAENARAFPLNSGLEIKKLPVIWCWRERFPPKQRLVWGKTVRNHQQQDMREMSESDTKALHQRQEN